MNFSLLEWNKPLSLIPSISIQDLIKIVLNAISGLIDSSDSQNIKSFIDSLYHIKQNEFDIMFNEISQKKGLKHRKFNNIVLLDIRNIKSDELFTKKANRRHFQQIRSTLKGDTEWILAISKDENILFSLANNHFLTWSVIPSSISEILVSFLMIGLNLLDSMSDDILWYTIIDGKKKLLQFTRDYFKIHQIEDYSIEKFGQFYLDLYHGFMALGKLLYNNLNIVNEFKIVGKDNREILRSLRNEFTYFLELKNLNPLLEKIKEDKSHDQQTLQLIDYFQNYSTHQSCGWLCDLNSIHFLEIFSFVVQDLYSIENSGAYYTPARLAEQLVSKSLGYFFEQPNEYSLSQIRVFDPAMGTGLIITFALEWLVNYCIEKSSYNESFISLRQILFQQNFFGNDIDDVAVEVGIKIMEDFSNVASSQKENFSITNFISNSLNKIVRGDDIKKYQIILTNPPYLAFHSRFTKKIFTKNKIKVFREKLPEFSGKRDNLYLYFMGICLKYYLSSSDGILGFVIDRSFLDLPTYKEIRRFLLDTYSLKYILENYTFQQAAVDLSLIVVGLNQKSNEEVTWQSDIAETPFNVKKAYFVNQAHQMFRYRKIPPFFSRIIKQCINLEDISTISCGLEYGALLRTNFLSSKKIDPTWYSVIDGSNGIPDQYILFWVPELSNSYVRYDKNYEQYLLDTNQNISKTGKRVILISGNLTRFQKNKILIRQTSPRFIASLDTKKYLSLRNTHIIYSAKGPYTLHIILGIINSSLGNWIGQHMNIIRTGGNSRYPQIRLRDLGKFPIVDISIMENQDLINKIEKKVRECIRVGEEISTELITLWEITSKQVKKPYKTQRQFLKKFLENNITTSSSLKRNLKIANDNILRIQSHLHILSQYKKDINDYIFDLYGLTEDERKEISIN